MIRWIVSVSEYVWSPKGRHSCHAHTRDTHCRGGLQLDYVVSLGIISKFQILHDGYHNVAFNHRNGIALGFLRQGRGMSISLNWSKCYELFINIALVRKLMYGQCGTAFALKLRI
jgi:hypothetical protein